MISARNLMIHAPGQAGRRLLDDVSLDVRPGEVLAIVGPNGAGKSTLLRALSGELRPLDGEVTLEGHRLGDYAPVQLARRRAVVSQRVALAFPATAASVAALGRLPWHGTPTAAGDERAVAKALTRSGVGHLADQSYATLSGGEQQRVQIARALAQLDGAVLPAALLLDEPTASLDALHRGALLRMLRALAGDGLAVLVVLHDLNEAYFVADRVAVLRNGRLAMVGLAGEVLTAAAMGVVYGTPFLTTAGGGLLPDYHASCWP